jgi:phosphatidylserine decarboxylase
MSGYVKGIEHIPGGFVPAFSKESDRNERVKIIFTTLDPMRKLKEKTGEEWEVVLIAGALARRIKPYIKVGDHIERGERIGHIEFGSRVDVVFPKERCIEEVLVKIGERVRAGESILMES